MAKGNVGKKPISQEEYITNKVLTVFSVCLLGVLVLMVLQRLLSYGNTWRTGMIVSKGLLGIGVIGLVIGVILLVREVSGKRSGARRILCGRNLLIASALMVVAMAAILYLGVGPIKVLYAVLPALAVYYLIYHSYAREFFLIAVDTGASLAFMWLVHRALATTHFVWVAYASLAAAVILAVVQLIAVATLRGKDGKFRYRGKKIDLQFSRNAYTMLTITPILMAVLVAVVLFAPAHILIAMGVAAAYLFITAVYYTVKLM